MSFLPPPNPSRVPSPIPTIRLIEATPAQSSSAPDASPLAPRTEPAPRKRLVRSKLNLRKEKEKGRDLSDIARRVGDDSTPSSLRGGFEIFVDSTYDPEIGELLVVKKKKSRAPLDGMHWDNALGEVTNVPSAQQEKQPTPKVKEEKWWAIGRGRKDSKEKKEKERDKSKSRAQLPQDSNSVDPGTLLTAPTNDNFTKEPRLEVTPDRQDPSPPLSRSNTPTPGGLLTVPGAGTNSSSIALRAIRSVRSLARIGGWGHENQGAGVKEKKEKEDGKEKEKKKKKKDKEKEPVIRASMSSFEAGALSSASPQAKRTANATVEKQGILNPGLSSSTRLPTLRSGSTASSIAPSVGNRLSMDGVKPDSAARARGESTTSSLRPLSSSSSVSRLSTGSSIRWDEECLESVKMRRKKEREGKETKEKGKEKRDDGEARKKDTKKESRRSLEGRRRTLLTDVFPEARGQPIVTIEEATLGTLDEEEGGRDAGAQREPTTPAKRTRPRPVSDQFLVKPRPKGIYEDKDGVISILDAATNDLALLINHLDLEATPGTPDMTPRSRSSLASALRADAGISPSLNRSLNRNGRSHAVENMASVTSLKPYTQSQAGNGVDPAPLTSVATAPSGAAGLIGVQIAPWPTLESPVTAKADDKATAVPSVRKLRSTHKRTMTPSPTAEPLPVFQPLCPARGKQVSAQIATDNAQSPTPARTLRRVGRAIRTPSSHTFGSQDSETSIVVPPMPELVFTKAEEGARDVRKETLGGEEGGMSVPPGGSDASGADNPDSDIPDELRVVLAGRSDGGVNGPPGEKVMLAGECGNRSGEGILPPSPGCPPEEPLPVPALSMSTKTAPPVFHANLVDERGEVGCVVDEGGQESSEEGDDTKKSFDFTGELKKLNESSSDRRSFVEQLENAFRTPAKVDLRYGFKDAFLEVEVPPVPKLPAFVEELTREEDESRIIDEKEPTLLHGSDSLGSTEDSVGGDENSSLKHKKNVSSVDSRSSDGELNTDFKFGGRPQEVQAKKPLTFPDIIPPSLSQTSITEEDSSVLNSIFANAVDIPAPVHRARVNSDPSSELRAREVEGSGVALPEKLVKLRHESGVGCVGFEEVRRGFEIANRQVFYPPASRQVHARDESVFSIASVSSYGYVIDPGMADPFDYGLSSLRETSSSEDLTSGSMSVSVDDTFAFLKRDPVRRRVNSDDSSFYFRAPPHRRHDSVMSVASQGGPPVSLYNRSMGGHRRSDSGTSMSSMAQSYAMFGANGGRAAWARHHRREISVDSATSEFSAVRLGRPGLGDKMFETSEEGGMPLTSIAASPPEIVEARRPLAFDSIIDDDKRSFVDDSLFDKTGHRISSMSSDSVFGYDDHHQPNGYLLPANHFKPLPVLGDNRDHSPAKEDDTMISMLGGGHVRRRSVVSSVEASPCVRFEKRGKPSMFHDATPLPERDGDCCDSPKKPQIVPKPSIASTTSYKFGGERMIKAQRGLLARESLEENCLVADGEDLTSPLALTVFSRPGPASRSRSSTCTTSSSGADTPPLSCSGASSFSEGSQSSIDLSRLDAMLVNATHPVTTIVGAKARTRARGNGHRRRISQACKSIYETIEEEKSNPASPAPPVVPKHLEHAPAFDGVYVVDPAETVPADSIWDDEHGIVTLRQYYALRDEAEVTVTESRRVWEDTPFSLFALQTFYPPVHRAGMQALLDHSVQNYGPLPSELRPRRVRSRTHSRPSPYPSRSRRTSLSSSAQLQAPALETDKPVMSVAPPVLQQVTIDPNIAYPVPPIPKLQPYSSVDVKELKRENAFGLTANVRPRVGSGARRTALGWAKRSTGKSSNDNKENIGQASLSTPGESLRINRPRPRGRPTPTSQRGIRA